MSHHFGNGAESRHAITIYQQLFAGAFLACRNHCGCGVPLNTPVWKLPLKVVAEKYDSAGKQDRYQHWKRLRNPQLLFATSLSQCPQKPEYKPRRGERSQTPAFTLAPNQQKAYDKPSQNTTEHLH